MNTVVDAIEAVASRLHAEWGLAHAAHVEAFSRDDHSQADRLRLKAEEAFFRYMGAQDAVVAAYKALAAARMEAETV